MALFSLNADTSKHSLKCHPFTQSMCMLPLLSTTAGTHDKVWQHTVGLLQMFIIIIIITHWFGH